MEASAEEVARREPSGENLRQVMPRAWALGMVWKGEKLRRLDFGCGSEEGDWDSRVEGVCERDMGDLSVALTRLSSRLSSRLEGS